MEGFRTWLGGTGAGAELREVDRPAVTATVTEEASPYPAPWIWRLVGGDRNRIVSIDYQPQRDPQGGMEAIEWTTEDGVKCIMSWVEWRVTYRDARGNEVTEPPYGSPAKRLPVYTRLPYPDGTDPKGEAEVARRFATLVKTFCHPVVASMDPNQRDDKLWGKVNDIVATKVFSTDTEKIIDDQKPLTIRFGASKSLTAEVIIPRISRTMMWTGNSYTLQSEQASAVMGQRPVAMSPKLAQALEPTVFGERNKEIRRLQSLPADTITVAEIRSANIEPKAYLQRLQVELEQDLAALEEVGRPLFRDKAWSKGSFAPSPEFSKFVQWHQPSTTRRLLGRFGLGQPTVAEKRTQLEADLQRNDQALQSNQTALSAATGEERTRLEEQQRVLQQTQQAAQQALQQLEIDYSSRKLAMEEPLALMETLQQRIAAKSAQLEQLLTRPVDQGGFGLGDPASPDLTPEERAQWQGTLNTNRATLAGVNQALTTVHNSLQVDTGLDFDQSHHRASINTFNTNLQRIGQSVTDLQSEVPTHIGQARASHQAHRATPPDAALRQAHQANLEILHRDTHNALLLMREIDRDVATIDRLLARSDIAPELVGQLQTTKATLQSYLTPLQRLREEVARNMSTYPLEGG